MRNFVALLGFLLASSQVFCQSNIAMGQEFAELAAHHGLEGKGFAAYQAYKSGEVIGSPYYFNDWTDGELVTFRKEVFNLGLQFVYDKVIQELYVRKTDSSLELIANKDEIRSFSLKDSNGVQVNFVNSKLFGQDRPEIFYQVLIFDSLHLSLFKQIRTTYVKANMSDPLKVNEGEIKDAYVDRYFYFIVRDGLMYPVKLKSKNIISVFQDLNFKSTDYPKVEEYLAAHTQAIDENYLIQLIKKMNENQHLNNKK
jgi:hypothetical protein